MNMILMTLIMMNILAISSNSWISLWVMMEMTTYIFLIYSMDRMEMKNKFEFMLTYFLMSFISSTFFLLSFMMQYSNSMNQLTPNFIPGENMIQSTLLTIAFLLKMGSIPFHPWVFSIVENLKWKPMMTMMTVQKIIPIWTLTFFHNQMLILSTILISSVIMMFIPLKTKSLYYFMASSATMNVIWILLSITISPLTTLIYSLIYFFLTISIILVFQKSNVKMMNQNFSSNSMLLAMLSLMGMPPLLGFIPKFNTMINSIQMSQEIMLLMILLVMANSINTIMYMKPMIPMMLSSHSHLTTSSIMMKNVDMVTWISHMSWPILGVIIYNLN